MPQRKKESEYPNLQFIKDLWGFFAKNKGKFIFFTILLGIASTQALIVPIIIAKIVDFFIQEQQNLSIFYMYLGVLLGVKIFTSILRLRAKYNLGVISAEVQKETKIKSLNKLMQGDLVWHEKELVGGKIQRISEGVNSIKNFVKRWNNQGVNLIVNLIGILSVFAYFNIKYALLALLFMVVYLFAEFTFNKKISSKTLKVNLAGEVASGKAYEISSNIVTVKSLGIEDSSKREILQNEQEVFNAKISKSRLNNLKWIVLHTIAATFYALFILTVGKDILAGELSAGVIVIYISYLSQLQGMLFIISSESENLIDIKYGIYRLMEIYNLIPDIKEDGAKAIRNWNKIFVRNLSFKYKDEEVLENFNLEIKKGDKIGIVGISGSGKSTFFKLLLKLYLPVKGMIYFDKRPIDQIKKNSLLKKISIVPQETELFNLSLRENILIAKGGKFDKKDYQKAIKISQVDKIIRKLEKGEDSLLGEKGIKLSGGERQRLGIARAIYKNSDIIIFDEATSNLDYVVERKIQESLDKLSNKTIIVAAHRLSTLRNMDKILVMKKGKIIENGTYEDLIKKKGEFYHIWKKQGGKR